MLEKGGRTKKYLILRMSVLQQRNVDRAAPARGTDAPGGSISENSAMAGRQFLRDRAHDLRTNGSFGVGAMVRPLAARRSFFISYNVINRRFAQRAVAPGPPEN